MAQYKFHKGTQAQYDAAKAAGTLVADDLYFIEDSLVIYKGENLLSAAVEAVTEFPAAGAQGRIYVDTATLEAKVWNGSAWVVVSPAVETTLTADTAAGALVTASAIRAYVEAQTGTNGLVQDVAYDSAAQKITVTYADDTTAEIELKNLVTDVAYDGATGNFTFSMANGDAKVVNTPVENFLKAAAYDEATHILTLTLTDDTTVTADLGELIDTYVGGETATANVAVAEGKITADVKVSAAENNALVAKEDGLFVLTPAEALIRSAEDTATVDINVAAETGALTADVKVSAEADNQLSAKADGLFVAKTDLSNYYNKTEVDNALALKANAADVYTKTETYTQAEVDAAIAAAVEAAHTWAEI